MKLTKMSECPCCQQNTILEAEDPPTKWFRLPHTCVGGAPCAGGGIAKEHGGLGGTDYAALAHMATRCPKCGPHPAIGKPIREAAREDLATKMREVAFALEEQIGLFELDEQASEAIFAVVRVLRKMFSKKE